MIAKKTLAATPLLLATVAAQSESTVAVYGILDVGVAHYRLNGSSTNLVGHSGSWPSHLGIRGTEDLGGGYVAGFVIEAALANDTGVMGTATNFWNRKSWVGISTPLGEFRLGRENSATYWNHLAFDPFGALGPGSATNVGLGAGGNGFASANPLTALYVSNSINYRYGFAPNSSSLTGRGLYFQLQHALSENANGAPALGRYSGARIGYAQGPLNMAVAYASSIGTAAYGASGSTRFKEWNLGASYDVGPATLMAQAGRNDTDVAATRFTHWGIAASIKTASGYIPISYRSIKRNDAAGMGASQLAIGYVHHLSKRTALYTSLARLHNRNGATFTFRGGNGGSSGLPGGGNGYGYDIGLRHAF